MNMMNEIFNETQVISWGNELGNVNAVTNILTKSTKTIFANKYAFAAINGGKVYTWGVSQYGGIVVNNELRDKLIEIDTMFTSEAHFIASQVNGTSFVWGNTTVTPSGLKNGVVGDNIAS